jgi:hypothetical protein
MSNVLRVVRLIPDESDSGQANSRFDLGLSFPEDWCIRLVARATLLLDLLSRRLWKSDAALQQQTQFTESEVNLDLCLSDIGIIQIETHHS